MAMVGSYAPVSGSIGVPRARIWPKPAKRERHDHRLGAGAEHQVRLAAHDRLHRLADGVPAGGAGAHHGQVRAADPVLDGDHPRGRVRDHVRQQERRDAVRAALVAASASPSGDHADPADRGADDHPEPIRIGLRGVELAVGVQQAGIAQRLARGGHREVRVAVVPPGVLARPCTGLASKPLTSPATWIVVAGGVEERDVGDAGAARDQAVPVGIGPDADR